MFSLLRSVSCIIVHAETSEAELERLCALSRVAGLKLNPKKTEEEEDEESDVTFYCMTRKELLVVMTAETFLPLCLRTVH